jgi:hypothetical protein
VSGKPTSTVREEADGKGPEPRAPRRRPTSPGERPGETEPGKPGHRAPGRLTIHGELLVLGIKVAASTVWEILHEAGIDPAPERISTTWATFLRSQAEAILAADFLDTVTLTGTRDVRLGGY